MAAPKRVVGWKPLIMGSDYKDEIADEKGEMQALAPLWPPGPGPSPPKGHPRAVIPAFAFGPAALSCPDGRPF